MSANLTNGASEASPLNSFALARSRRLLEYLGTERDPTIGEIDQRRRLIGFFEGTGVGPEVIAAALQVLSAVSKVMDLDFEVRQGGVIGEAAEAHFGRALSEDAIEFCRTIFAAGGAILSGPGGGRFVYDLRREFDLFCKFVPVTPVAELLDAGCLHQRHVEGVDLLIIRDNIGGVYQGSWTIGHEPEGRIARHTFCYSEAQVRRILDVAVRAAAAQRGRLHVVLKDSGVPTISDLWIDVAKELAGSAGVECLPINVDLAAYQLIQNPGLFDVIVAPNLIGDILADVAGALVVSRGVTFSGNFTAEGHAVYQTNHGCAHDLARMDVANPGGQILSLAMLLRESFGLEAAAQLIENALAAAWAGGHRTADVARPGGALLGTRAMTEEVIAAMFRLAKMEPVA